METFIDPFLIKPLHDVRNPALLAELTTSMEDEGWRERPLLVIKCKSGYLAWTGSHRIAPARAARLREVPCYVLQESKFTRRKLDVNWGIDDSERLKVIQEIGDEGAINLMWSEGRT